MGLFQSSAWHFQVVHADPVVGEFAVVQGEDAGLRVFVGGKGNGFDFAGGAQVATENTVADFEGQKHFFGWLRVFYDKLQRLTPVARIQICQLANHFPDLCEFDLVGQR